MPPSRTPRRAAHDPRLTALAEESGYEILGKIGTGGMGIVYRAHDADGNDVALKLLRHEISEDVRARERLAREVTAQKLVRNDNIVRILDAELDSPEAFVVTEFIPGPTLEDAVRTHGGLHPEAVREIALVMGETLRAIHGAGVIHRDLKPGNVMLRGATEADLAGFDPEGDRLDPVIIDFGIAIAAEESRLTSTGLVMGTAAYLDPEVIRTDHSGEAGDWWAWAALLAFAATGREPYGSGRADLVFLRAERGEIDIDGVPTELAQWLRSALQSDPAQRPEPAQLLERLAALDLTRYDDPGDTDLLQAGARTSVLPVAAPAAGAAGAAGAGTVDAARESDAQRPEGAEPETDALPVADDAERTTVLPTLGAPTAQSTPAAPAGAPPPTARHAVQRPEQPAAQPAEQPAAQPTEALPRVTTPEEPVTEALPVMGAPTRALPVVPPPAGADPMLPGRQSMVAPPQQAPGHPGPLGGQPLYPGAWPEPPPRRPLLVWLGHLLIVSLAAVAPYMSLAVLLVLGAMARTWERSHQSVSRQRIRGAAGAGPSWRAGLASPFRAVIALWEIALQALLPLLLGGLVGIAFDAGWTLLRGIAPPDGVAFALAMAITLLITWVGLGSLTTRNGAHRMLDAAAPDRLWSAVVLGLLLLLLGAVLTTVLAREGMVDYFPFPHGPRLDDIAVWRG
ncbi:serine/threonine-protein kinase [Brachybacterium vulturis]|nr:serine/threonine-protein kinase [Brachybacterium vulturis]